MLFAYQKELKGENIGIVFGSFSPLHQGHLDLIMRAKKENDGGCIVIVCGFDGDKGEPYNLTHKTPSDGLCGKTDEDKFGFTYKVLNRYIRTGVCENPETKAKIDSLHEKNLFKLQPIPSFHPTEKGGSGE